MIFGDLMAVFGSNYLEMLDFPHSCNVRSLITKEETRKELKTAKDRKIFSKDVKKNFCHYVLKESTIYIKPYEDDEKEYSEILVIEISLYSSENTKKIAEMLMKVISYPVLLFFNDGTNIQLAAAHQRKNLSDADKYVLEEVVMTDWFPPNSAFLNQLSLKKLNKKDLYSLYSDYVNQIYLFNASQKNLNQSLYNDSESARQVIGKIQSIDDEIISLRSRIHNKETSGAEKINLNIRIHQLKKEREKYLTPIE